MKFGDIVITSANERAVFIREREDGKTLIVFENETPMFGWRSRESLELEVPMVPETSAVPETTTKKRKEKTNG